MTLSGELIRIGIWNKDVIMTEQRQRRFVQHSQKMIRKLKKLQKGGE